MFRFKTRVSSQFQDSVTHGADGRLEWPFTFAGRPELHVESESVPVVLRAAAPGEPTRLVLEGEGAQHIEVSVEQDDDELQVTLSRAHGPFHGGWKRARALFVVPPALSAQVSTDAGSIAAFDLGPCELELEADAGQIRVERITGKIRLSTDAGQIKGHGLRGSVEAETDAGAIELSIDGLDPGVHSVQAEVGSVRVALAPGLDVRIDARTELGSRRVDYASKEDAEAVLDISTEVGMVRVTTANPTSPQDGDAASARFRSAQDIQDEDDEDGFFDTAVGAAGATSFAHSWPDSHSASRAPRDQETVETPTAPEVEHVVVTAIENALRNVERQDAAGARGWGTGAQEPTWRAAIPVNGDDASGSKSGQASAESPLAGKEQAAPVRGDGMDAEIARILAMVEQHTLSARDAAELLSALDQRR